MTDLGDDAIDLLLSVLEAPEPILAGAVMQDFHPLPGAALNRANLLVPDGYELVVTASDDHADVPVAVLPSEDGEGYGYFSSTEGWTKVDDSRLVRYRADLGAIVKAILPDMDRKPLVLSDGALWDLGTERLGRRTHQVPIWFARRVHDPRVWSSIRETARRRPSPRTRLILTSTPPDRHPRDQLTGHRLAWVGDLRSGAGLQLDCALVSLILDGTRPSVSDQSIQIIAEAKVVRLHGQEFRFPKAVDARAIIMLLYERYLAGERWVSCDEIVEQLDLPDGARIRDYFDRKRVWNRLVTQKGGMCGFCLDDD